MLLLLETFDYTSRGLSAMCTPDPVVTRTSMKVTVQDNTKPIFTRVAQVDTLVICNNVDSIASFVASLDNPAASDNCDFTIGTPAVALLEGAERCDDLIDYIVTWVATDALW